jgi:hypothetical protein
MAGLIFCPGPVSRGDIVMARLTALLFCVFAATAVWSQQDVCSGYQDSPDTPHKGPRKFNVIHLAFSQANIDVLIVDPLGRRFGVDANGQAVPREIPRAFYEDDNAAESDTTLSRAEQPREITIHYALSGNYLIAITARKDAAQWLKLRTSTCGRRWQKTITVPASHKEMVSRFTLIYDSHAKEEPQLLDGDHTRDRPSR